jgi:hypothetical protein
MNWSSIYPAGSMYPRYRSCITPVNARPLDIDEHNLDPDLGFML